MNFDIIRTSSLNNTFKNTGVYKTSITLSGNVSGGTFASFDSTISLTELPVYAKAVAQFKEFASGVTDWWDIKENGSIVTTAGTPNPINFWIFTIINGLNVTFRAQVFAPSGAVTLQNTTVNIRYVTYTLAR